LGDEDGSHELKKHNKPKKARLGLRPPEDRRPRLGTNCSENKNGHKETFQNPTRFFRRQPPFKNHASHETKKPPSKSSKEKTGCIKNVDTQ